MKITGMTIKMHARLLVLPPMIWLHHFRKASHPFQNGACN
jgi:hypothetical protein